MMEIISIVPKPKALLQVSMNHGRRFKKGEKVFPVYTQTPTTTSGSGNHWTQRYPGYGAKSPKTKEEISIGNLVDYRFWAGAEMKWSSWRMCRACGFVCYSAEAAKEHMENTSHTTLLVDAYKLVSSARVCADCGKKDTNGRKWGINLCSPGCIQTWMFRGSRSEVVKQAVDKVLERIGKRTVDHFKDWRVKS